jgi:hypothetical protein
MLIRFPPEAVVLGLPCRLDGNRHNRPRTLHLYKEGHPVGQSFKLRLCSATTLINHSMNTDDASVWKKRMGSWCLGTGPAPESNTQMNSFDI